VTVSLEGTSTIESNADNNNNNNSSYDDTVEVILAFDPSLTTPDFALNQTDALLDVCGCRLITGTTLVSETPTSNLTLLSYCTDTALGNETGQAILEIDLSELATNGGNQTFVFLTAYAISTEVNYLSNSVSLRSIYHFTYD